MKSITEVTDLKDKRVLVRVDWSVPMQKGKVINDYQIKKSFPTIEYLQKAEAKIVLVSHAEKDEETLRPIFEYVRQFLPLTFIEPSDLVLLENLRQNEGEKSNSAKFAQELASLADIYVNEAFAVSHREHASIVGVPKLLPSYAGVQFSSEIQTLSKIFYPKRPFLFILGGAKFDTKLPLLEKFINIADHIFVGGALAHNFFKEMGQDIGSSLVSDGEFGLRPLMNTGKIILPEDTVIKGDKIMDAGAKDIEQLKTLIENSKLVVWNGPLGSYEEGYKVATLELARAIAGAEAESIIGGGDTLTVIEELGILDEFSFVSTGGGAMLDFLAKGTLPGLEALSKT